MGNNGREKEEMTDHVYSKWNHAEREDDGEEKETAVAECVDPEPGEYLMKKMRIHQQPEL